MSIYKYHDFVMHANSKVSWTVCLDILIQYT